MARMLHLRNVASITPELAAQIPDEAKYQLAVFHVAKGQDKGQQFAPLIDHRVELETEKPAHGVLAPLLTPYPD